jgi:hypothetical protein
MNTDRTQRSEKSVDFNLSGMRAAGDIDRAAAIVGAIRDINPRATETQPGISCELAMTKWDALRSHVLSLITGHP